MILKYKIRQEAEKGAFSPFIVAAEEITLTSVTLEGIVEGDLVSLNIDISWLKPMCDLGELEIFLRKDTPNGPVLYWTLETCFAKANTRERYSLTGEDGMRNFYLTVRSSEEKAILTGYALEGSVSSPA
jgi:hypothetical protein